MKRSCKIVGGRVRSCILVLDRVRPYLTVYNSYVSRMKPCLHPCESYRDRVTLVCWSVCWMYGLCTASHDSVRFIYDLDTIDFGLNVRMYIRSHTTSHGLIRSSTIAHTIIHGYDNRVRFLKILKIIHDLHGYTRVPRLKHEYRHDSQDWMYGLHGWRVV